MSNKPTTLREEFQEFVEKGMWQGENEYTKNFAVGNIADWWLDKLTSHNTELLQKIEERQKLFNFIPQDKYGYKRIKATDLDIISLINQYK